ncbi:Endogenous Retrovirus Group K Member 25 Env Polyprotein [Manis pentadactyla]|nr:Endogenous Retrovirus Group K Member 25 Env Polyprotein [Manis pentadactyla]
MDLDSHRTITSRLTSCISSMSNNTMVLLLKQPPFLLIPVNYTGLWYDDKGLVAAVALTENVQTAIYVNGLTQNATQALNDQGNIEEKIVCPNLPMSGEIITSPGIAKHLNPCFSYNSVTVTNAITNYKEKI